MRVLITGGTGFIGAYIIKHLLQNGHSVRAFRRTGSKTPFFISPLLLEKVEWVVGDVLDISAIEEALQGMDAVVHAAAIVSFHRVDAEEMFRVNVEGTANMVNIAIEQGVRRFIHISSVAALGRTVSGETVSETREWQDRKANTNYAVSKHKAEMEVWRAIGEGLQAAIINPSTVLGFGDWNTSSCAIFRTVYNEFPFFTQGINGFVYVEDVARATVQLLESDITRERFIINGDNWSFQTLFNTIADGFAKKRPHVHANSFLASVAWRWEKMKGMMTGRKPLLSKESARVARTKTYFDNSKFTSAFPGFAFTPLPEAVAKSCRLYLDHLKKG